MNPLQVLATCGIVSGVLSTCGGLFGFLPMVGVGALIMLIGNIYALTHKDN